MKCSWPAATAIRRTVEVSAGTSALLAGVFWIVSAYITIPEIDQSMIGLTENPAARFNSAVSVAALWNGRAAVCASFAAMLQAGLLFWPLGKS